MSVGLVLIYPVSIFAKVQSLENLRHIPVEFMHIDIAASSCSGGYYDLRWEIRGFCGTECDHYRHTSFPKPNIIIGQKRGPRVRGDEGVTN